MTEYDEIIIIDDDELEDELDYRNAIRTGRRDNRGNRRPPARGRGRGGRGSVGRTGWDSTSDQPPASRFSINRPFVPKTQVR